MVLFYFCTICDVQNEDNTTFKTSSDDKGHQCQYGRHNNSVRARLQSIYSNKTTLGTLAFWCQSSWWHSSGIGK